MPVRKLPRLPFKRPIREVALAVLVLGLSGCAAVPTAGDSDAYAGVSADRPTGSTTIDPEGLVLALDMTTRTRSGRLRDFSSHGHDGIVTTSAETAGRLGGARRFQVPEDRVDLPETPAMSIDGPLTLALWVRVNRLGLHQHLLACDDKFALWITPEDRIRFSDTLGRGMDTERPIQAEQWMAVVAVFSGRRGDVVNSDTVRLYLDGKQVPTLLVNRPGDRPPRWMPGELYENDACHAGFESHQGDARHQEMPFVGDIDDLMVFGRAWSPNEVRAHARSASSKP